MNHLIYYIFYDCIFWVFDQTLEYTTLRKSGEKSNSIVLIFVPDNNILHFSFISVGNHPGFNITFLSPLFSRFYLLFKYPVPTYLLTWLYDCTPPRLADIVMEIWFIGPSCFNRKLNSSIPDLWKARIRCLILKNIFNGASADEKSTNEKNYKI